MGKRNGGTPLAGESSRDAKESEGDTRRKSPAILNKYYTRTHRKKAEVDREEREP